MQDGQLPMRFLCTGRSRTSLLATVRSLAGELAVLRMVEREGERVQSERNRRQDLKRGEVKLNSLSQLNNVVLHLEAYGVTGNKLGDLPFHPALHSPNTFTSEARKDRNVLPVPWSTRSDIKKGHRVLCFQT